MTCCGLPTLDLNVPRFADFRRTITPQKGYTFNGFTARMQIRSAPGDPVILLNVAMTPTANGSLFEVVGDALVLTIDKADITSLPDGVPITKPANLWYDILVTDQTGLESYLFGGRFIVIEGITQ